MHSGQEKYASNANTNAKEKKNKTKRKEIFMSRLKKKKNHGKDFEALFLNLNCANFNSFKNTYVDC